jgi:ribonucleoside-diphosphate reductase alpha chain
MLQDILEDRYLQPGEKTFSDVTTRVSSFLKTNDKDLMDSGTFLYNSPALMNAGTAHPMMSACFVLPINDSLDEIYDTLKRAAKIFKVGGGVGINFSPLRPKGAPVKGTGGTSSGAIAFIENFNSMVKTVESGGRRRGAAIAILNDDHPDIIDFVKAKSDNESDLKNFNLSVLITDKFLEAVQNDAMWELRWNDRIFKTIPAKELFNLIIDGMYSKGEPGILFFENANRFNPMKEVLGDIYTCNPCLHEDSLLFTTDGLQKISQCNHNIWNGSGYSQSNTWSNGIKETIRITTKSGFEWITTPDHRFLLKDGDWCEAQYLMDKKIAFQVREYDWVGINPHPDCDYEILGFEFGDGSYHKASKRMKYIYATPGKDEEVVAKLETVFNGSFYLDCGSRYLINIPFGTIYTDAFIGTLPERMIPDWILSLPKEQMRSFLKGLFSANGTNLKKYFKLQLVSSNKEMLQQVQQMLLLFGIKGKLWWHNREVIQTFYNGDYTCKQSWHIVISGESYDKFFETIGFIQSYKMERIPGRMFKPEKNFEVVCDISDAGMTEVWDFNEPINHYAICSGAFVHNCGEILACVNPKTGGGERCILGSANLSHFGTVQEFDINRFKEVVRSGVIGLNEIVDKDELPLPEVAECAMLGKKIGFGIMGFADLLVKSGIPYNSDDAILAIEKIGFHLKQQAIDTSIEVGSIKGPYKEGQLMRNACVLSIAPTGTLSILANCSSGIEPVYKWVYDRVVCLKTGDTVYRIIHPLYEKLLDEHYSDHKEELLEYAYTHGSIQNAPYISKEHKRIYVVASDIEPGWQIHHQATWQKYVDQSISKTCNVSSDTTKEEISQLVFKAHAAGIKGFTLLREWSRNDAVMKAGKETHKNGTAKRKKELTGKTMQYSSGCGTLYITVNFDENGKIIEVLANPNGGGCNASIEAMCRLASVALRNNHPITDIIRQLRKVNPCVAAGKNKQAEGKSCADIIGRCLAEHLKDQGKPEVNTSGPACPECGAPVNFADGCRRCTECSWSKCG